MRLQCFVTDCQGLFRLTLFCIERSDFLCEIGGRGIESAGLFHLPGRFLEIFVESMKYTKRVVIGSGGSKVCLIGRLREHVLPDGGERASAHNQDREKERACFTE